MNRQKLAKCLGLMVIINSGIFGAAAAYAKNDDDDTDYLPYANNKNGDWVLVRSDEIHHIKTYSKQEDNRRFRSFKAQSVFNVSLEASARCLFDIENMPSWYMNAVEAKMLKRVSDTEYYYYFRLKTPMGVPQRDVVVHAVIVPYSEKNGALTVTYNAAPDFIPARPDVVRMPAYEMVVKFRPLDDNTTEEEYEGYADPGGSNMPVWLTNYVQRRMPYLNMLGKHRALEKCAKSDSPIEFKYKVK